MHVHGYILKLFSPKSVTFIQYRDLCLKICYKRDKYRILDKSQHAFFYK
ncbi:hypothetical protein HMPREF9444_01575 [Succinatimonas hippei YIT 12066]|uniref:Uncharacterized protein n=1 Tax=Succinatimonas hippei (strain DSM 22608 / JCM 16073 / KCTC 15190 / YIT 12066) TaxID=762983 RepID=E8LLG0_SUCHY|nr:hypothetical protein HMPREF9444_01575 [Succinatimonas hippei YIT 12066]